MIQRKRGDAASWLPGSVLLRLADWSCLLPDPDPLDQIGEARV